MKYNESVFLRAENIITDRRVRALTEYESRKQSVSDKYPEIKALNDKIENAINEIKRIIKPNGTFVKIYMSYMLTDDLANESHKLVKKLNKNWTPGASGSKDIYNHPFENGEVETFECNIPFTRESWHGRMLACRGTMASMDEDTLNKWNKKHLKLLEKYPEEFEIRHKVYIAYYRIEK